MWGKIFVIFVGKLYGLHKNFPYGNVGMVYCNACNAVHANKIYTHENHCFSVKRIFYTTKITRYTVVRLLLRSRDTHTCSHFLSSDGTNAKL